MKEFASLSILSATDFGHLQRAHHPWVQNELVAPYLVLARELALTDPGQAIGDLRTISPIHLSERSAA